MRALTAGLRAVGLCVSRRLPNRAPAAVQRPGVVGPEGLTPRPDRFVRDGDPAFGEQILDVAEAQAKVCRCGSSMQRRPCRWTRGATSPVSRRRCFSSRTHDPLTRYFAATSAAFIPASLSRCARSRRSIE